MKFMITMTFDPARQAEILTHIPAEQARVRELMAQGTLDMLHIAQAQDRVWLVLNAATADEAHQIVAALPLHAYSSVDLAPLASPM